MIKVLLLGGTGAIGTSILSLIGNDTNYDIVITSRKERVSDYSNVRYVCGNANELSFLNTFENASFDVLIDFMNYRNEILKTNILKLLQIANQYIFISSARVYDHSQLPIDENCPLLLHSTKDLAFRDSGTYAVKKASQEQFVLKMGGRKVTIIRPYKTYSSERLQLGEYEIKHWLDRILCGKPIVLNRNILSKYTALTDGRDVAAGMVALISNQRALGETFQIVTDERMTWHEILQLYAYELNERGINPVIYLTDHTEKIDIYFENGYQMPYDILFDRYFSSHKIEEICPIPFQSMRTGLKNAISHYLDNAIVEKRSKETTPYDLAVESLIEAGGLSIWK